MRAVGRRVIDRRELANDGGGSLRAVGIPVALEEFAPRSDLAAEVQEHSFMSGGGRRCREGSPFATRRGDKLKRESEPVWWRALALAFARSLDCLPDQTISAQLGSAS